MSDGETDLTPPSSVVGPVLSLVGVDSWPGAWPEDLCCDPALLAHGAPVARAPAAQADDGDPEGKTPESLTVMG